MTILFILLTSSLDKLWISLGENCCWSLLGLKGLKYAKQYANNRTNENWELKKRWRNIATKYRRQVIQEYWQRKTEDLKAYPREFYKTFRPFLSEQEADYSYLHGYLHTRNDRF